MVEVPEDDRREGKGGDVLGLLLEAGRRRAVRAGGAQQPARLAGVARYAAIEAHLPERHVAPVIGEDHREGGGSALDGLELQDRRSAREPGVGKDRVRRGPPAVGPRRGGGRGLAGAQRSDSSHIAKAATASRSAASAASSARGYAGRARRSSRRSGEARRSSAALRKIDSSPAILSPPAAC